MSNESPTIYKMDGYYISKYAKISAMEWEKLDYQYNRFVGPEDFLTEVDYYVEAISDYLGSTSHFDSIYDEEDIRYKIMFLATDNRNESSGWVIYLNKTQFKQNDAPIAHEVTHFLTPFVSRTLSEGLAQLMQCQFGRNASGGDSVHRYSRPYLTGTGKDQGIIDTIGIPGGVYPADSFARDKYYMLSHSFVKYLIDQYGVTKFMEVYQGEDLLEKYEEVYGLNLEDLRNEWMDFIIDTED